MTLAQIPPESSQATQGRAPLEEPATVDLSRLVAGWMVPVVLLDAGGRVRAWNRGATATYGVPRDQAVGEEWSAIVGEDQPREATVQLGPETVRYETRHRGRDGRPLDVLVTRSDLPTSDGAPGGAILIVIDLTGPKSIEARLKRRIGELSIIREIGEVLQSTMDLTGILRAILVGATASQGLRFNRAFLLLVDAKRGEIRGRVAIGPSDPEEASRIWRDLSRSETRLKDLLRKYEPYFERSNTRVNQIVRSLGARLEDEGHFLVRAVRSEKTIRVMDGRQAPTGTEVDHAVIERLGVSNFVAVPLRAEGKAMGLLLADNAITGKTIEDEDIGVLELLGMQAAHAIERTQLSGELETQVASLEKATREIRANHERLVRSERLSAIGEMAARVAHEIRNPLVAIGGFARLLLREAPAEGSMRENIQIIASEVRRLETILREVLDFSNPTPPKLSRVDLARLGLEALDLLQWEMHEGGIVGRLEAEPGLPDATADRNQVFQALINVMHNAIHAMSYGGTLTLRVRRVAGWLEMAVEDTGGGMSPDVRARVFEPFYTTKSTGSGLGLTIAQQILREHRGEIQVDSRVGEGTTLFLRLPVVQEESGHDHVEDPRG